MVLEAISKTRLSCLTAVSSHLETIKARGRRPSAFIRFSVSGNFGQTLALVFDILHKVSKSLSTGCSKNSPPGEYELMGNQSYTIDIVGLTAEMFLQSELTVIPIFYTILFDV